MSPDSPTRVPHDASALDRRQFLFRAGGGFLGVALGGLWAEAGEIPNAIVGPHLRPKARSVIFLFMAGGPSQLDLFEHKPVLDRLNGQPIPESYTKGKRFAFMDSSHRSDLLASKFRFQQHGQCGAGLAGGAEESATVHGFHNGYVRR